MRVFNIQQISKVEENLFTSSLYMSIVQYPAVSYFTGGQWIFRLNTT